MDMAKTTARRMKRENLEVDVPKKKKKGKDLRIFPLSFFFFQVARFQAASLKAPSPDWTLGSSILGARNAGFWPLF